METKTHLTWFKPSMKSEQICATFLLKLTAIYSLGNKINSSQQSSQDGVFVC